MAVKITYNDKDNSAAEDAPEKLWRDVDANEIKVKVNIMVDELETKVNKVNGKELSTNDYNNDDRDKVANTPLDTNAELSNKQPLNSNLTAIGTLGLNGKGSRVLKVNDDELGVNYELPISSYTDAERDALTNADEGLIIYNTTVSKFQKYTSSIWEDIGGGSSITVANNAGVEITNGVLTTKYNTSIADDVKSMALGGVGAQPASFWKNLTIVESLDAILFPTVGPSVISNPSLSLNNFSPTTTIYEVGTSLVFIMALTYGRGTIRDGNGVQSPNPYKGPAISYTFNGPGTPSESQASNSTTVNYTVTNSSVSWNGTCVYDIGTGDYFDNKGNISNEIIRTGGTIVSNTRSISGLYPWYHLRSNNPISVNDMATAISNGTATRLLASSTGTLNVPYNISGQYLAVAYPATSTTKTNYSSSGFDSGPITNIFSPVQTENVNANNGLWSNVSYKIHTSPSALSNTNTTLQLKN